MRRYAAPGSQPGTLNIGIENGAPVVSIFKYSTNICEESHFGSLTGPSDSSQDSFSNACNLITEFIENNTELGNAQKDRARNAQSKLWVDIRGIGSEVSLRRIAELFRLHDLTLADIVHVPQRAKIEKYDDYTFIITSIERLNNEFEVEPEQVSIIVGTNFILTFQEKEGDVFDPVRARLRSSAGAMRSSGTDYLAYALLDASIDNIFPVLERLGDRLDDIEEKLVSSPERSILRDIHITKRSLLRLRRAVWPHREILSSILRGDHSTFKKTTLAYLRDTYDHTVEAIDIIETYRELSSGYVELYVSSISNRLNDVMKMLTVISTVFIPLSFFTGVYGMNFKYMPELEHTLGYPIFLVVMMCIASLLLVYFWKKGWLRNNSDNL